MNERVFLWWDWIVLIPYCLVICSILGKFATGDILPKRVVPKIFNFSYPEKYIWTKYFLLSLQIYILTPHIYIYGHIYINLQTSYVLNTRNSRPDPSQWDVIRWSGGQSTSYWSASTPSHNSRVTWESMFWSGGEGEECPLSPSVPAQAWL